MHCCFSNVGHQDPTQAPGGSGTNAWYSWCQVRCGQLRFWLHCKSSLTCDRISEVMHELVITVVQGETWAWSSIVWSKYCHGMSIKISCWLQFCVLLFSLSILYTACRSQLFRVAETDKRDFMFPCKANDFCWGQAMEAPCEGRIPILAWAALVAVCLGIPWDEDLWIASLSHGCVLNPKIGVVWNLRKMDHSEVGFLLSHLRYSHWKGPEGGGPFSSAAPCPESGFGTSCEQICLVQSTGKGLRQSCISLVCCPLIFPSGIS